MPRYFFDFASANLNCPDDEGTVLPDLSAAKEEAGQIAAGWIKDNVKDVDAKMTLTVRNGGATPVFSLVASISFTQIK